VRLRGTYFLKCTGVIRNAAREIEELRCTYDPATRSGDAPDGRKVKATIHWVSAPHARDAEVRLYDRLFLSEDPGAGGRDFLSELNSSSLEVLNGCKLEPSAASAPPGTRFQFERIGYFCVDPDSSPDRPVFNRTVGLKDTWARIKGK
jgi:glutaminyl-tRNA synthetase